MSSEHIRYFYDPRHTELYRYLHKYREISKNVLVNSLEYAIKEIHRIIQVLEDQSNGSIESHFESSKSNIGLYRGARPLYGIIQSVDHNMVDMITSSSDDTLFLSSLNSVNIRALEDILNNKPVVDVSLAVFYQPPGTRTSYKPSPHNTFIWNLAMIDGAQCENCGSIRKVQEMARHKLHPECKIEADRAEATELGLVKINNISDAIAVMGTGIEHKLVSEFWAVYSPRWVADAIKAYNTNGGYAGMTLEDFLKSMDPKEGGSK